MTAETSSHAFPPFAAFLEDPGTWPADAPEHGLAALMAAIARACQWVGKSAALGRLMRFDVEIAVNVQGETQKPLDIVANDVFIRECGPLIRGLVSEELDEPLYADDRLGTAPYLLLIDPLDGSANMELAMTVGAFFSVLRAPSETVQAADFLQPGDAQIAAGYALFGPTTMLVLTVGRGTHGFTLDPEDGEFHLTHPHMAISPDTREFAINASNARFWEPPVQLYIQHCQAGADGPRAADFNMRWNGALVAELHRVLVRGGVFLYPFDNRLPKRKGRLRLLYEANPSAMLVEAAGGAASSGRGRILEIIPQEVHERAPLIFGPTAEIARLEAHHADFDRGEPLVFQNPLFRDRTLFRTA
jgi:fructose-1,6-bisphosphatase